MNQEAVNLADLLNGDYGKTIVVAEKVYFVKAPTIKTIMKAISFFGKIESSNSLESFKTNRKNIVSGIASLVSSGKSKTEENRIRRELTNGTDAEILEAMNKVMEMIACKDFFVCAGIATEIAKMAAVPAEKQ